MGTHLRLGMLPVGQIPAYTAPGTKTTTAHYPIAASNQFTTANQQTFPVYTPVGPVSTTNQPGNTGIVPPVLVSDPTTGGSSTDPGSAITTPQLPTTTAQTTKKIIGLTPVGLFFGVALVAGLAGFAMYEHRKANP